MACRMSKCVPSPRIGGTRPAWLLSGSVTLEPHELELHGHRVSYRTAGSGPALLLLHGITNSSETWERVAPLLGERFTLIAPDLLGHGAVGDAARRLLAGRARQRRRATSLTALGHERVTVVGHSLGGGIAMQFAYQFPERCERLVLVSSGGLGREVHFAAARRLAARRRLRAARAHVAPACSGSAAASAACCGACGCARRRRRGARPRVRRARQRRLAPGVPAHGARRDRARRPARERAEPARASPRCCRR